ncbi:MAG: T9SS type A sorting domain-containing protein [Bacteroidota bacterium]
MKLRLYLIALLLAGFHLFSYAENPPPAPLPAGVIAPDFTVTDINGNVHTLYDYLDAGIDVILDFSATWCGPCWSYHQSHILTNIFNANEAMVLMVEADASTPTSCIYGNCSRTIGNWTIGTPYPIINLEGASTSVSSDYAIQYYPTLYGIAAYNKKAYEIGQASRSAWQRWLLQSFQLKETSPAVVTSVACYGEANGSIDVTVTGGYAGRSYRWNTGARTEDLSNLLPGDYYLTVTEGQGHSIELGPFTVDGPSQPVSTFADMIVGNDCAGGANGAISVSGLGGTPGYSYQWSNGAAGATIVGLPGGSYTVTITDAGGCTGTAVHSVPDPPVLQLAATPRNENCGSGDGELTLFGFGGTPGYLYDIGFGVSPSNFYNQLSAGTYIVTITDANGCTSLETAFIENTPAPIADAGGDTNLPCNADTLMLDATASSSGPGYNYSWSSTDGNIIDGGDGLTPIVDAAGTYILEITNANSGCTALDTVAVGEIMDRPTADAGPNKDLTCADLEIELDGTDSSVDTLLDIYSYAWTGPAGHILEGDSTLRPLVDTVGEYILEVTNTSNGCISLDTVTVGLDRTAPNAEAGNAAELTCIITDLLLDGSGSSTDTLDSYDYQWSSVNGNIVGGDTSLQAQVDAAGTYILQVTNSRNGCSSLDSVSIINNTTAPTADAGANAVLNCSSTELALDGSNSSTGNNFVYLWNTTTGHISSGQNTLYPNINAPGLYVLQVTDNDNGCSSSASVAVSQDIEAPIADAGATATLDCNTTQLSLDGSNSSTGNQFTYLWSTSLGRIINGENTLSPEIGAPGTYTLQITNTDNGCVSTASVAIDQDMEPPTADAGASATLDCNLTQLTLDGNNSSIGGQFNYLWTTSLGRIISGENTLSPEIGAPGTYNLQVINTDNGCASIASVTIDQDVETPIADAGTTATLDCGISELTLDGSNSSAGSQFSYMWITPNGSIISGQQTLYPTINTPGTYTLMVTNNDNGCGSAAQVAISQDLNAPTADAGSTAELNCQLTQLVLDGSGSSNGSNFTYQWTTTNGSINSGDHTLSPSINAPGTYLLQVTNTDNQCSSSASVLITEAPELALTLATKLDNPCHNAAEGAASITAIGGTGAYNYDWSNGGTTPEVKDLAAGNYSVVVSDEVGCTVSMSINISEPAPLVSSSTTSDETADGADDGTASISISGGTPPYAYLWNTGQSSPNISDLTPGIYTVSITDANGCKTEISATINSFNCTINGTVEATNISCNGAANGTASVNLTAGDGPYTYQWSNGGQGASIGNLSPGSYAVTATDDNNCPFTANIIIEQPSAIVASVDQQSNVSCFGGTDGTASLSASGGTGTLTYLWPDGSSSPTLSNLAAGSYIIQIRDANGCTTETPLLIDEPTALSSTASGTDESALGAHDGQASASVSGGTPPYAYLWSNGSTESSISDLAPGSYTVQIRDANGCSKSETIDIKAYDCSFFSAAIEEQSISCFDGNDGQATAVLNGGTPPFNYNWSNGSTEAMATSLSAGSYTVTITDAGNCPSVVNLHLDNPTPITVETTEQQPVSCFGGDDGMISISAAGGTGGLSYLWPSGNIGTTETQLAAGSYTLTITDSQGCLLTRTIDLNEPALLEASVANQTNVQCADEAVGTASISAVGGVPPFEYTWSDGQSGAEAMGLMAGQYEVIITDQNGCSTAQQVNIIAQDDTPPIAIGQTQTVFLNANGQASISADAINNGSSDNCGIASIEIDRSSFSCSELGEQMVELTVKDASGNSHSTMVVVTIVDDIAPTLISCPSDIEVNNCDGLVTYQLPEAVDNCELFSPQLMSGLGSGAQFPEGTTEEVYQFTDAAGNTVSCSFMVTVTNTLESDVMSDAALCFGETNGTAEVVAEGGTPGYTYVWSNGQTGMQVDGLAPGTYTVEVVDASGCTSSNSFTITELPELHLTVEEIVDEIGMNGLGSIDVSINGGTAPYTYTWSNNGTLVSTAEDLVDFPAGDYELEVVDAMGCIISSNVLRIDNLTSVIDPELAKRVRLFPNPSSGQVYLELNIPGAEEVQLSLYDAVGRQLRVNVNEAAHRQTYQLDLDHLPAGVYWLRILVDQRTVSKRIVLSR